MKIAFYFLQDPIDNYMYDTENKALLLSILKKANRVIFYIPYTPAKGMLVDLARFNSVFGFSKAELSLLNNLGFYIVSDIVMAPEHVELWLTFKDEY